jgi:hypothetical protein
MVKNLIALINHFKFHNASLTYQNMLSNLNIFFTCIFTLEFILKIAAFRVKVFY